MPINLRPREKALRYGLKSLDDREILALFIRTGSHERSALNIADDVLNLTCGMENFAKVSLEQLMTINGIKEAKAIELLALVEMGKRIVKPKIDEVIQISEPTSLINWLNFEIGYEKQEHFLVVYMNNQNVVLNHEILFKGTVDRSIVHPRDVFRQAVSYNATRLILVHNHPGGTLKASRADLEVTDIMVEAGRLVDIEVLDHIIVTDGKFASIRERYPDLF